MTHLVLCAQRVAARGNCALLAAVCAVSLTGCPDFNGRRAAIERAQTQVRRIAADVDRRTTETGVYVRVKAGDINETDPWGTRIEVSYSQGGVAETVSVRSAGPDRQFFSDDDLVASGVAVNLKGIGEGIKANAGKTAAKVAKGVVKGTVDGIKESVKENLPFRKRKGRKPEPAEGATEGPTEAPTERPTAEPSEQDPPPAGD